MPKLSDKLINNSLALFAVITKDFMNLHEFLTINKSIIAEEATESLHRAELKSYKSSPIIENKNRIEKLLELTISGVDNRTLFGMTEYSEKVANERFTAGFDLHEVHTAFNVLEETIWKKVVENFPASELGNALGLISTVLGAGKETLALTYVSLASKRKTSTLNLSGLFGG
ncbi:MAG: hypothetical protein KGZ85_13245 [Ignavibacterium sp.]|nr:hypothetical protein [Ignavibacterium sp.]